MRLGNTDLSVPLLTPTRLVMRGRLELGHGKRTFSPYSAGCCDSVYPALAFIRRQLSGSGCAAGNRRAEAGGWLHLSRQAALTLGRRVHSPLALLAVRAIGPKAAPGSLESAPIRQATLDREGAKRKRGIELTLRAIREELFAREDFQLVRGFQDAFDLNEPA